jgi:hypothetical protein
MQDTWFLLYEKIGNNDEKEFVGRTVSILDAKEHYQKNFWSNLGHVIIVTDDKCETANPKTNWNKL